MLKLKEQWTRIILEKLPNAALNNINTGYTEAMQHWWMIARSGGGLRLTNYGHQAFKLAGYVGTAIELEFTNINRNELWLLSNCNSKLKSPYFFETSKFKSTSNQPKIIIYDDDIAIAMSLYGSLVDYLENAIQDSD